MKRLDLTTWSRRDQYQFFLGFDEPFFNICTEVEAGPFRAAVKGHGHSFFLACVHAALTIALEVPAFRYRLDEQGVIEHDRVHASATVLGDSDAFRFCWLDFEPDFRTFQERGRLATEEAKKATGPLDRGSGRTDVIHFSVLPWIRFTSVTNPRRAPSRNSVPKIIFGKCQEQGGKHPMPISIELHHALGDGLHVARFLEGFQALLLKPDPYSS